MRGKRRSGSADNVHPITAVAASLVWNLPLPEFADVDDVCNAVGLLHGRRLVFAEMPGARLRATTGILVEAQTFTGILVVAEDSAYYSTLSKLHELGHLIVRQAPDDWFPEGVTRPKQPHPNSPQHLRLCPRNSSESADADTVWEEAIVEEVARELMRRLASFGDSSEEEHFG
jgi:hypothetical protein